MNDSSKFDLGRIMSDLRNAPFTDTSGPKRPTIGMYTDFRLYLSDFYEFKKKTLSTAIRPYSYSAFSAAANIKSPNYLKLIIEGQRNLSAVMAKKFAKALQLTKEETNEFSALVQYGQAQDPLERNRCLKALADIRVKQQLKDGSIKNTTWEKVPNWVTWVLYALADQENVNFDVGELRTLMRGRAKLDEIKKALKSLLESGELKKDELNGGMVKGRLLMSGASDIPKEMVRKLQSELIYLGLESLFQDEAKDREFGALTVALTADEFEQLKFELRQMRKRIFKDISLKRQSSKGERVYQMNIQLFPVTDKSID